MLGARLLQDDWSAPAIAAAMLAGIVVLYLALRPSRVVA
jgi:hypothetical protein